MFARSLIGFLDRKGASVNTLILLTDIIEKAILLLLAGLSIWSISIIINRRRYFKTQFALDDYYQLKQGQVLKGPSTSFYAKVAETFNQKSVVQVDRAYSSFVKENREQMEKGLNILATLGANAPFIGLFGTVLGIIRAMAYLGNQSGSSSVMTGVSQALYATALGLFVAVPAVIAFNSFSHQIKKALQKAESLKDFYIVKSDLR